MTGIGSRYFTCRNFQNTQPDCHKHAGAVVFHARETAAAFFDAEPDRVVFTQNCTHALNLAIYGLLKKGDHVIISDLEHNSVARPVAALAERGVITYDIAAISEDDEETVSDFRRLIRSNTRAVIFWELTKYILSKEAVFNDEHHTFVLRVPVAGQRTGKYAMLKNTDDATPYRLSSPLAQHVLNTALSLSLSENAEIVFDRQALPMNANLPDYLNGSKGYMVLASLGVSALSDEQYLLFNAFTNDGRALSQEDCEKLFLNGGNEQPTDTINEETRNRLQSDVAQHSTAKLKEIDARNLKFFQQEETRIYQWEHDVIDGIEDEITTLKKNILTAERDARNAQSVAEKLEMEKKVEEMKRKRRRLRNDLEDREEEVSQQRKKMITELEQRMVKATESHNLFVVKWRVKENSKEQVK